RRNTQCREVVCSEAFGKQHLIDSSGELVIELESKAINRISHASSPFVTQIRRKIRVQNDELHYTIDMATESNPVLTKHLEAVLHRQHLCN
ncbi:hypothetical protein BVRB_039720, partial [Beta vulgaris subsp. vulgaris]